MYRNRFQRSTVFAIPILVIAGAIAFGLVVHAQAPDFVIASTPSNLCVNPGVNAISIISVESTGGFTGTISLSDNVDPAIAGGPSPSTIPSSETLATGQTVSFNLEISTTTSTPVGIYYATVSGLSGASFHQTTVQLIVSSSCSVGGSVLSIDKLSLLSPLLGVTILSGTVAALVAGVVIYRRKTVQSIAP